MVLRSRMKMTRFQTCWIQMRKNKPLEESRKTSQTSGTKMTFYSEIHYIANGSNWVVYVAGQQVTL
ncbi:hypothetical protein Hanom_Chr17g01550231 [Helianthus anomalus]